MSWDVTVRVSESELGCDSEGVTCAGVIYFMSNVCRQQDLRKVLKAFAHHNDDIGYCQVRQCGQWGHAPVQPNGRGRKLLQETTSLFLNYLALWWCGYIFLLSMKVV